MNLIASDRVTWRQEFILIANNSIFIWPLAPWPLANPWLREFILISNSWEFAGTCSYRSDDLIATIRSCDPCWPTFRFFRQSSHAWLANHIAINSTLGAFAVKVYSYRKHFEPGRQKFIFSAHNSIMNWTPTKFNLIANMPTRPPVALDSLDAV